MASYGFRNVLRSPYSGGSIRFGGSGPHSSELYIGAGSRVKVRDLYSLSSRTVKPECRCDVKFILNAVTGDSERRLLYLIDEGGTAYCVNASSNVILARLTLSKHAKVLTADLSEDGKFIAVGTGMDISLWRTPCDETEWLFSRIWKVRAHSDKVKSVCFSKDAEWLISASSDCAVGVWPTYQNSREFNLQIERGKVASLVFNDHRRPVKYACFAKDNSRIFSISSDGHFVAWQQRSEMPTAESENANERIGRVQYFEGTKGGAVVRIDDSGVADNCGDEFVSTTLDDVSSGISQLRDSFTRPRTTAWKARQPLLSRKLRFTRGLRMTAGLRASSLRRYNVARARLVKKKTSMKAKCLVQREALTRKIPEKDKSTFLPLTSRVWLIAQKFTLDDCRFVSALAFNRDRALMAIGLSSGTLVLFDCHEAKVLYRFSVGSSPITTLDFSEPDGEWLAIGLGYTGELCVWEWKSETFIFRDKSDVYGGVKSVAIMPPTFSNRRYDANQPRLYSLACRNIIASGDISGQLQICDSHTGQTLASVVNHHLGPINGLCFTPQSNAVLSVSSDGTVKAYDILKNKTFRTMRVGSGQGGDSSQGTGDEQNFLRPPPQLAFVAIDSSGEIVAAAGSGSDCRIYLFSLQTGKILETVTGHMKPITDLAFSPSIRTPGVLASTDMAGMVAICDVFGRIGKGGAMIELSPDKPTAATCLAFDPRGNEILAVAYMGGQIVFWDTAAEEEIGTIDGQRDIHIGRVVGQRTTADNSRTFINGHAIQKQANPNSYFSKMVFTANGLALVCAAKFSPKICVYSTETKNCIHSFFVTKSFSLDGVMRMLNSKNMTDSGISRDELDLSDAEMSDIERHWLRKADHNALPGTTIGPAARKAERRRFLVWDLAVSQDSKDIVIGSSHGIFCYSIEGGSSAVPCNSALSTKSPFLTAEATVPGIWKAVREGKVIRALTLALSLGDETLLSAVYLHMKSSKEIALAAQILPLQLLPVMLSFIQHCLTYTPKRNRADMTDRTTDKDNRYDTNFQLMPERVLTEASRRLKVHLKWLFVILMTNSQAISTGDIEIPAEKYVWNKSKNNDGNPSAERGKNMSASRQTVYTLLLSILKEVQGRKDVYQDLFDGNLDLCAFLKQGRPPLLSV